MTVEWTDNALAQLRGIHDYIARGSDFFAKRMVDRLTSRSIQIRDHPFSGEMVPEFGDALVREVIEGPYRMIYRISAPNLFVLAVIHGSRLLTHESIDKPE